MTGKLLNPKSECETVKSEEICTCARKVETVGKAKQREKCISAYVIASPVKQGKTLNKFSKKVPD